MPVEVAFDSPLATAINTAIQPKLQEVGWASESDASSLAELIVLMLANGKSEEEIATEMAGDLLHLEPGDSTARDFAKWLFQQIDELNAQMNGVAPEQPDADTEMDTDSLNAPTGPRAMRNGQRGARAGRILAHVNRAMDRSDTIHRVRQNGNERINSHNRQGQRGRGGRMNPRNIQAGLAAGPQQWMMNQVVGAPAPNQADLFAMLEHQNQMMLQLSQLMNAQQNGGSYARGRGGKSLFDRVQDPNHRNHRYRPQNDVHEDTDGEKVDGGEDTDMSGREPTNSEETICKYNLRCTNKECKFAHQSPAAPPGVAIDASDTCSFGAACKNHKCVARHPSPATKLAHQSEQDCKFFPNCQNLHCPFKHPSMPLCRNGASCMLSGCKFTHVKIKCKFNPCLNPNCAFTHDEGQQGGFKDKVWTADEHVSDRKFVEESEGEELVKAEADDDEMKDKADIHHQVAEAGVAKVSG